MEQFLSMLAEVSLAMAVVIAVLLALSRVLERRFVPQWRCWAWLAVALRLCLPFNLSLAQAPVVLEAPRAAVRVERQVSPEAGPARWSWNTSPAAAGAPSMERVVRTEDEPAGSGGEDAAPVVEVRRIPAGWLLAFLWGAGALLFLGDQILHCRAFRRRIRRWSRPAGTYGGIPLLECGLVGTPLLMGWLRPVIVTPTGGAEEAALLHEYTHARRRDLWFQLLLVLANAIHWFNPLVWGMRRVAERDVEMACDAQVLQGRSLEERRAYGRAILDQMTAGKGGRTGLTTGFTGDRGGIFLRFRAIMDTTPKRRGRLLLASASILILLAGGLVSCAPAAAESSGGALELSGADAGPGEMLPLEERFESYNRERGRSLPVSRGEWAGEVRYRFADQEQGVEVLVGLSPGKGDPFPAEVLFQRRSFGFDMPVLPLAQGGAEGSASLSLADLTGDGVPELVYIWGGGGTGAWEDNCRVFDLSTGEEYPILLDPELMLSQVRAERLERREDHLIYQVTGPGGQSGEAALWCPESDQEPEGGPALGQISLIRMNETGDALEWTASLTLEGPPVLYGNSLGELTAVLEFSPSLRAFTAAPPWGMVLYPLE